MPKIGDTVTARGETWTVCDFYRCPPGWFRARPNRIETFPAYYDLHVSELGAR